MAKNRATVTCNGRVAFYACMWDDIRQCAMDNGWAVALHQNNLKRYPTTEKSKMTCCSKSIYYKR